MSDNDLNLSRRSFLTMAAGRAFAGATVGAIGLPLFYGYGDLQRPAEEQDSPYKFRKNMIKSAQYGFFLGGFSGLGIAAWEIATQVKKENEAKISVYEAQNINLDPDLT